MTQADFGSVANGYQALKGMLFTPSAPECLERLIDWLEASQINNELLAEARKSQNTLIDLECDFNRMCVGPTRLLVPPYESVYCSVGSQLNTKETVAVADFYQNIGLVIDKNLNEPADYIGNELEFLFCLEALNHQQKEQVNHNESTALDELAQLFISQHLGRWYQDFTYGIEQHTEMTFWRHYAQTLRDFLAQRHNPTISGDNPLSEKRH
ncbi:cytoplasmic chaperone TorD family protein [Shewanella halifaxensis HAW-EB4]|uniref:Cytoplasmic chaperone TorD family protein n=1 Tax=Shewanella halifaxensis (strain HAW-EB4) TaxID=458817 RepID=B0TKH6_SHEHH|nr:molecular chaperone TorD family protein [Shewanella halifaxensis]ABZ78562.1 cytoplasmic chaperone TorD family protein [Shewanella halifaxensis HAW-EB4]